MTANIINIPFHNLMNQENNILGPRAAMRLNFTVAWESPGDFTWADEAGPTTPRPPRLPRFGGPN